MRRIILFLLISLDFLLFFYVYHSFFSSDNNFRLIFCDVGQGDGIFMRTPGGFDVVIDGGPTESSMTKCLERHLPFWDRTIDAVFLTHPDSDHLTGLIGVAKSYNVRYFGTAKAPKDTEVYQELRRIMDAKKVKIEWVFRNDKVVVSDGLQMIAQWPTVEFLKNPSDDTNDYSLVHLVKFGNFSTLLTGDIPAVYLNSIMSTVGPVDVFKSPHHGSRTGIDEFTFQHIPVPKLAVISVDKENRYGHPHKEVIQVFESRKIPYKYTFEGDVIVVSDGKKWWVE